MELGIYWRNMVFWWMVRKFLGLLLLGNLKVSVIKRLILLMAHCFLD